jgi:gliding motility-associated-like protein
MVQHANAQILATNTGTEVTIEAGLVVTVEGGLQNQAGEFRNGGELIVQGDILNFDANQMFVVDNAANILSPTGIVRMDRAGNQTIGGTEDIRFDVLQLRGTGTKSMDVDAFADTELDLSSLVLETRANVFYVRNTNPNAIKFTTGYATSQLGGWLYRSMDRSAVYEFPVGSPTITPPVRQADITYGTTARDSFGIRLSGYDPNLDGFLREDRDATLCEINNLYYHNIVRNTNTGPVGVTLHYNAADPIRETMGHFGNANSQWDDMSPVSDNGNSLTRTGWDSFGSRAFAFALIKPEVDFVATPTEFCPDEPAVELALTPRSPGTVIILGDGVNNGFFNPATAGPGTYVIQGIYRLPSGCADTALLTMTVNPNPVAIATGTPRTVFANEPVQFDGRSSITTPGLNQFSWELGNGDVRNGEQVTYAYADTGQFIVELTVRSPQGCSSTDTVSIYVESKETLFLPNVFTPNGDGINDIFGPIYNPSGVRSGVFIVYDRWGAEVYRTGDLTQGWKGLKDGKPVPEGVYVYFLSATFTSGRIFERTGSITLLR